MIPTLFVSLLGAVLFGTAVLGTMNPAGPGPINARNATGGPVKPATTRDYIMITIYFTIAIAAILIGLANMR